jgi:hypothetical protein
VSSECHCFNFETRGLKIHKGFFFVQLCLLPITISKIQALLAGNISPSCGGRFMRRRRNVSRRKRRFEGSKGFSLRAVSCGLGYYFKNTSPYCRRFRRRRRRNVSHKENEDSKVYKRFEGLQRFLLQPQFLPHRFDTSSISR